MKSNIFENITKDLDLSENELFDDILSNDKVQIQRIVSKGHTSPKEGWYNQKTNEWVIVLKGAAIIEFENKEVTLNIGDYINIKAFTKHKVRWTDPDVETIWIAVHY